MSKVSGVTVICSLMESDDEDGKQMLARLNDLLAQHGKADKFKELSELYGGGKHPQHFAYGAGINYLDEDKFARELLAWPWNEPEEMVLVIHPEDGPIRVFRPGHDDKEEN